MKGTLAGKYAGVFVSTSTPGGGQESTAVSFMSTLVHQGIIFVPLGYASGYMKLLSLEQVHGGESCVESSSFVFCSFVDEGDS